MGRHAAQPGARRPGTGRIAVILAALAVVGVIVGVTVDQLGHSSGKATASASSGQPAAEGCTRQVHVVTASSFLPVLQKVSGSLGSGPNCIAVKTTVADGQAAANVVASSPDADVWISDDGSWRNLPNDAKLTGSPGSTGTVITGTVIATSPMYFGSCDGEACAASGR